MKIKVSTKQIGSRRAVAPVEFVYPNTPATVRELITETVRLCVEDYNHRVDEGEDAEKPLSLTEIADKAYIGKIAFGVNNNGKHQEPEAAVLNAIQSFEDGIFRVFHGDTELTVLDSPIELSEGDTLTFIRLTMLSGRMW